MTKLEQALQQYEARPAAFDSVERDHRSSMLEHFSAINKFEGIVPTSVDKRLFHLLAQGKISKQEYLQLCLADARAVQ